MSKIIMTEEEKSKHAFSIQQKLNKAGPWQTVELTRDEFHVWITAASGSFRIPDKVQVTMQHALNVQVGGAHYKNMKIQPIEYCMANELNSCETAIVKYISRWREKGGIEDLEKIKHYVDLLIQLDPSLRDVKENENAGLTDPT